MTDAGAAFEQDQKAVQQRLVQRLFGVLFVGASILIGLRLDRGARLYVPGFFLIAFLGYGFWTAIRRRIRAVHVYSMLLLLSGLELYWGLQWGFGGLPGILGLIGSNGLILQLCWSPRAGWSAFGLSLLNMAVIHHYKQPFSPREANFFMDLGLTMLGLQASAWAYGRVFSALGAELAQQRQRLVRIGRSRAELLRTLLQDLEKPLTRADGPEAGPRATAQALQQGLQQARSLREGLDPEELRPMDLGASRRLLQPLLGLGIFIAVCVGTRDLLSGQADAVIGLSLAGFLALMLLWLRRRPAHWDRVAGGTLLAAAVAFLAAVRSTPDGILPGVLTFGTLLITFAALWLGQLQAVIACAGLLLLGVWVGFGRPVPLGFAQSTMAVNFSQQWIALTFIIAPAARAQQSLLHRLDEQAAQLAASLRVQRRLLGTLFHDAANHVMALGQLAELGGDDPQPADAVRFERLRQRLARLFSTARRWLFVDEPFGPDELQAVEAETLGGAMQDLFKERLQGKGLRWQADLPRGLRLKAVPELLTDGVLGNLVSNAIKFSPRGGVLRLQAHAEDGQICLSVLDQGPGLPPELIPALRRREDLSSRPGSEGETGQGLGLALAAEHLRRMGGRLRLLPREGGGTDARIWLPRA